MFIQDSASIILKQYLTDIGFFSNNCPVPQVLWSVFNSALPDEYDNMVSFMRCKGRSFGSIARTNDHVEHFGVAIHVRTLDEDLGFSMAAAIDNKAGSDRILNAIVLVNSPARNITNRYKIHNVYRTNDGVVEMGQEPKNRRRWCFVVEMYLVIRYLGFVTPMDFASPERISITGDPDSLITFC